MTENQNFKGYRGKIALRIFLIVLLLLGLIPLLAFAGMTIGGAVSGDTEERTEALEMCEWDYYRGEYAELLNTLQMYEFEEEEFAKYWELGYAYEAYQKWEIYSAADGYEKEAEQYAGQVRGYAEGCIDSENERLMRGWLSEIEKSAQ